MSQTVEVKVPDIGDFKDIPVIEVLVKPGDSVNKEDSLITLESDTATMEVPSPESGVVKEVKVKVGDKVSEGLVFATLTTEAEQSAAAPAPEEAAPGKNEAPAKTGKAPSGGTETAPGKSDTTAAAVAEKPEAEQPVQPIPSNDYHNPSQLAPYKEPSPTAALVSVDEAGFRKAHASPSVRHFARELGVDLSQVKGSGPKNRILTEDVQAFVKSALAAPAAKGGGLPFDLPPLPEVDFTKFGAVEVKPLSRIRKLSGANLHRNWVSIPHITQHDEADITELEAFRKGEAEEAKKKGVRFTLLAFLMKAVVVSLRQYPEFNASLSADGENLILKQYFHIGVAVDTPQGLVVPVIRDVDRKGLLELARELGDVSARMRDGKITPTDLQGGCFSISSLGGIGGSLFTPIINAPEVAILGVGRSVIRPVYRDEQFVPRLMLPLSLSYDHRVIDGAQGARFISFLSAVLSDIRRLVL
jgi:pyruvate dehydrogenase E2 component (dihydrolipoamide acetyltransferase)